MQTYEQAVEKTVNWWIEKSFKTRVNQNNGDDSENGGLAFMLMNVLSMEAQDKVTDEQIEKFRTSLTEQLMNPEYRYDYLMVDYHPCQILAIACEHAGIDSHCMPVKSHTHIQRDDNKVFAKHTYGGQIVEI